MPRNEIDMSRLAVLSAVSVREKAEMQSVEGQMSSLADRVRELRREILSAQRRSAQMSEAVYQTKLAGLEAEQQKVKSAIEAHMQTLEILRERASAANRLHQRCAAWATQAGFGA